MSAMLAFLTIGGSLGLYGCGGDGDADGDGVLNGVDNCPTRVNPLQVNTDGDTESNDGMDCFVLDFEPGGRSHYASANFTVFGQTDDDFIALDNDPDSVGYRLDADESAPTFATHMLDLDAFRALVIVSDGILDQKGGPKGLSLGRRRLLGILHDVAAADRWSGPVDGAAIVAAVESYQGENEQRDDISLVVIPMTA